MGAEGQSRPPVAVESILVRKGRLVCTVAVADPDLRYSTPALAALVAASFPDLPHHACVNGEGRRFSSVMERTSVPHMLEHLAIQRQLQLWADGEASFVGTTEWVDEGVGRACIQLSFLDDLVALRAFNEAVRFLNDAMLTLNL